MDTLPPGMSQDEERLGGLARRFRRNRRDEDRRDIARDYAQTVERLIRSGNWNLMPALEDQLPDDWMPPAFFEYWGEKGGSAHSHASEPGGKVARRTVSPVGPSARPNEGSPQPSHALDRRSPNLFDFATSELSQDAFICWLASWADPVFKEEHGPLHDIATAFLTRLLEVGKGPRVTEFRSVEVRRQRKGIDVLLVVNNDAAIIIEDKTDTTEHSRQLERYREVVAEEFPPHRIAAVYFKTGDQGDYAGVDQAGYGRFLRRDFLDILDRGESAGVENDIFADYRAKLRRIESAFLSYQNTPVEAWPKEPDCWTGLFTVLQQRLGEGEWDSRGAPGGGTPAFRWHWKDNKFLRLMHKELCFRIRVPEESERRAKWREWKDALKTLSESTGITLQFPPRRPGVHMGVATLEGGYLQADAHGLVDLEKTVQVLRKAEALMDAALLRLQSH